VARSEAEALGLGLHGGFVGRVGPDTINVCSRGRRRYVRITLRVQLDFKRRARGLFQPASTPHVERKNKLTGSPVKILTGWPWTCRRALLASSPPPSKRASCLEGGVHSRTFDCYNHPLFFIVSHHHFLCAAIGTESQCHYYYSLDQPDKTCKHGAAPPLVRDEIIDGCTAIGNVGVNINPLELPFTCFVWIIRRLPGPPALRPVDAETNRSLLRSRTIDLLEERKKGR
jgi:hypothetical protein